MNTDDPVRSIPALAQWAADRYGDAEAVVDGGTRLTFRELGRPGPPGDPGRDGAGDPTR